MTFEQPFCDNFYAKKFHTYIAFLLSLYIVMVFVSIHTFFSKFWLSHNLSQAILVLSILVVQITSYIYIYIYIA